MREIIAEIERTADRCTGVSTTVQTILDAAQVGFLVGILQSVASGTQERSLRRRTSAVLFPDAPAANPGSTPSGAASSAGPGERIETPTPEMAVTPTARSGTNWPATAPSASSPTATAAWAVDNSAAPTIERLRELFSPDVLKVKAGQAGQRTPADELREAGYEAINVIEHLAARVLPKIDLLADEYQDKKLKVHHDALAQLVKLRGDAARNVRKILFELFKLYKQVPGREVPFDAFTMGLDFAYGRGRDILVGLLLACTALPEISDILKQIASRLQARIALMAPTVSLASEWQAHYAASPIPPEKRRSSADQLQAATKREPVGPVDFVVLTAIHVELWSVLRAFGLTNQDRVHRGTRVYWFGTVSLGDKGTYTVVVALASDMANTDAALATADMIREWSPRAALLVGIAATADPTKAKLGDVVAASEVYYFERGKQTRKRTLPEPKSIPADARLSNHVRSMQWEGVVDAVRPDGSDARSILHHGVIACGERVIADALKRDETRQGNRKVLAIEMEGYGFSMAVWHSLGKVHHLVIRAICDEATDKKDDRWHEYAARAAASFAREFLLDCPLPLQDHEHALPSSAKKTEEDPVLALERAGRVPLLRLELAGRSLNQPEPGRVKFNLRFTNEGPCPLHDMELARADEPFAALSRSSYHPREKGSFAFITALPPNDGKLVLTIRFRYSNGFGNRLQEEWALTFDAARLGPNDVSVHRIARSVAPATAEGNSQ